MNTYRLSITAFAILLVAVFAPFAAAQSTSVDIEAGYQEVDVTGNEDMFRTQINQQDGFVLRNFSINYVDPTGNAGFVDRLRVDASGFGGNPAGRFRLRMGLGDIYRVNLYYQNFAAFSALPAYANPLLDNEVFPGQHTWERDRDLLDLQIEILPGRAITPIVGYRWNSYDGPGRTTYSVGQRRVRNRLTARRDRAGVLHRLELRDQEHPGNVHPGLADLRGHLPQTASCPAPVPATTPERHSARRSSSTRSTARPEFGRRHPGHNLQLTGRVTETSRFVVVLRPRRLRGRHDMDEDLSGSLVSFQLSRFFQGLDQSVQSRTENPYWRGEARFEWDISQKVGMRVGYEMRDRQLEGWALISSLYMDTLNFGGFDPQDIETLVEGADRLRARRGHRQHQVRLPKSRRLLAVGRVLHHRPGRRSLGRRGRDRAPGRPGRRVRPSDLVLRPRRHGEGRRLQVPDRRRRPGCGRRHRPHRLQRPPAFRGRVDWSISRMFRLLLTAESIDADNDTSGIGYQDDTDRYAVDLNFTPTDNFMLRAAWDTYQTDTEMPIRVPQTFEITPRSTPKRANSSRAMCGGRSHCSPSTRRTRTLKTSAASPSRWTARLRASPLTSAKRLHRWRVRKLGLQRGHVRGGRLRRRSLGSLPPLAPIVNSFTSHQTGAERPPF